MEGYIKGLISTVMLIKWVFFLVIGLISFSFTFVIFGTQHLKSPAAPIVYTNLTPYSESAH